MDELLGTIAHYVLRWGQNCRPFPAPALFLRCASDSFSLTKPNTFCKIEWPASLGSKGVRVHPGMPFGFSSETAFGFAGILRRPLRGLQGQGYGPEARLWGGLPYNRTDVQLGKKHSFSNQGFTGQPRFPKSTPITQETTTSPRTELCAAGRLAAHFKSPLHFPKGWKRPGGSVCA
jgi:hypothetical protein